MGKGIHCSIEAIAFCFSIILGSNAFAADPCAQTTKLSGGTVISGKNIIGTTESGYQYELWREIDGGELTLYPQDACFKASWDNPNGDVIFRVGKSFDNNVGGDLKVSYAFQTTGDDGGTYSSIGVEGWMNDGQVQFYIVEDWMGEESFVISPTIVEKGEYVVDGETYKVLEYAAFHDTLERSVSLIWSVRQSRRQCGTVDVSEHIRNWKKLGVITYAGALHRIALSAEAAGGKGSVDFTYANIEEVHNDSPEVDPFPSDSTVIDLSGMTVTDISHQSIGNGYSYNFYHDRNNNTVGMNIYGGSDDCAFRAEWHEPGEFLAETGYLDESSAKQYGELGEITADYCYTKTGNCESYSYFGVHGFMCHPDIEYYIVDDAYISSDSVKVRLSTLEEIGSYEMDGEVYTLYKKHYTRGDMAQVNEINVIWAVRSSFRTSGHISVSEHFKKWEEMALKLSGVYSCMLSCDVYGGTGSIDYSKATMSWKGLKKPQEAPSLVGELSSSDDIILTPNPAENYFTVKSAEEISSVEMLDLFGRSLNSQSVGATVTFDLPAGTYLVKVTTVSGNTSVQKLMVK